MKKKTKLMLGDNMESLKKLPDNCIDSIVTDPPYGLSFMNKKWDHDVPSVELWKEVYRVLKPGGHLLSFGGTRTYHRMVVNIEDAGFEIRDQIMWLYGSGFPKSHNIGKAIDKLNGDEREVVGKLKNKGDIKGLNGIDGSISSKKPYIDIDITKGNSPWEGWGTALKPANEPICLARKPLEKNSTIAANVLKHGTGGLNIDGCRVETTDYIGRKGNDNDLGTSVLAQFDGRKTPPTKKKLDKEGHEQGRFPANIILDEEAGEILDEQSGESKSGKPRKRKGGGGKGGKVYGKYKGYTEEYFCETEYGDKGGASRFFYCPKVSKKERNLGLDDFEEKQMTNEECKGRTYNDRCANCKKKFIGPPEKICSCDNPVTDKTIYTQKNNHPTVKPVKLMRYLCRLITPPCGLVLDPYMGSGATGIGALLEGFRFCGMEMDEEYFNIAKTRINKYKEYV